MCELDKPDKIFATDLYLICKRSPSARVCMSDKNRLLMFYLLHNIANPANKQANHEHYPMRDVGQDGTFFIPALKNCLHGRRNWMFPRRGRFSSRVYMRMFLPGTISPGTICKVSIIVSYKASINVYMIKIDPL